MKALLRRLLRLLYGFRAYNESALTAPGPVLLLPNHTSWWDWLLIGVCLESDWRFVTSRTMAEQANWLAHRIMHNRRTFPVDINSPYAVKHIAEYLQRGGRLVLFPEGRLSRTGSLMKLFDGTGFLIFKTRAKAITAYIRGAHRLPWSPNPNRKKWFPRLSVHFSDALPPPKLGNVSATEARTKLTGWLLDRMLEQQYEAEMVLGPRDLPAAITEAARQWPGLVILQDISLKKLTYRRLRVGADLLARQWRRLFGEDEQRIGLLLPNVNAFPVTLLSLWAANKVPAILNYSGGVSVMLACAQLANLRQIITSKAFLERTRIDRKPFNAAGIKLVYLEEVQPRITRRERFSTLLRHSFPWQRAIGHRPSPDATAVVLFTSGSEGPPKGVELTHRNLLANVRQMMSAIDVLDTDRFFNALPLFHSFGLTIGLLLPLVRGAFVLLYPSPLHYRVVPSAFYNLDCTIMFGTNTFLTGYARKANPFDFRALRYLFAGAEKLQETTATVWARKFGVRIIEGYGATECSPCLSANTPLRPRHGSAGRFLPRVEWKLEPVEGVHEGGRLFVRGPNVMRGYLNADANAKFRSLDGWYDTGDIASVDADGYVFILGRLKRFAKVSGEMVSLAAVEEALAGAFPQYGLRFTVAVVARPDTGKGERLIAVTNEPRMKLDEIREVIRARGLPNIAAPREIRVVHNLPKLGTGKVNHRELEKIISGHT